MLNFLLYVASMLGGGWALGRTASWIADLRRARARSNARSKAWLPAFYLPTEDRIVETQDRYVRGAIDIDELERIVAQALATDEHVARPRARLGNVDQVLKALYVGEMSSLPGSHEITDGPGRRGTSIS